MNQDEVLNALREAASEILQVEPAQLNLDTRFKEDLDADSLDLVEVIMALEERFEISIPEEDLEGVTTVGAAVDLVVNKLSSGV